jgi:hypothetical protein
MTYQVGQIVYLLDNKDMKIFPARIEEEIVRRRIGEEETNYKVALPNKERSVVDLSDLDVSVFTSPADVRSHMAENALRTIDGLIERARKIATSFDHEPPPRERSPDPVREDE